MASILILLLKCVALATVYYAITSYLAWRRLRAFPGPRLASFSYLWIARTSLSGRMWAVYRDVSARYGSITRIGPNELITDDPALIRRLSATVHQYRRSSWYAANRLDPYEDSMFSLRDNAAHDRLKGLTAPGYAGRENPGLESEVDAVLSDMIAIIRERYIAPEGKLIPLDLARMVQYFTLDSITKIAFGEEFGFLRRQEDVHSYIQSIEEMAPMMQTSTEIPALASIVSSPLVLKLMGPKVTDKKGIGRLMA